MAAVRTLLRSKFLFKPRLFILIVPLIVLNIIVIVFEIVLG